MPKLSDTKIRKARAASGKPFKLYDEQGLFLLVHPSGGQWWRYRYTWEGREQLLSLGVYPHVTLAMARERRDEARGQLKRGINPSLHRKEKRVAAQDSVNKTYKAVSLAWLEQAARIRRWTKDHVERVRRRQEVWFWPWMGDKTVDAISDDEVLTCLKRIVKGGLNDTAYRGRAEVDQVFRYAKGQKFVRTNPVADLRGVDVVERRKVKHHSAITDPTRFGDLLRAIDVYAGGFIVRCALRFQALVWVRPTELRLAEWGEFDFERAEWRIPALKMKMDEQHIVPLSRQALTVLRELRPVTGPDGFVFTQARNASRPISNNTLNAALRTIGLSKDEQTAHGFRTSASTLLNESGDWSGDAIEAQLSHGERDKSRAAYNHAKYLKERRLMMQAWGDYLDILKARAAEQRAA